MLDRNTPINHTDFENAKKIELRRWNINKFLEVIPCDNQESVSRRWVLSLIQDTVLHEIHISCQRR